jgi:hypothetical protein
MNWRVYLILALAGLCVAALVAVFQGVPGYMDADYYFAGGLQLAAGRGFSEPYLWNYLDDPAGLPHPSHAYWMPLTSLLAAAGMRLAGTSTWFAARLGFFLLAAVLPPLTARLSHLLTARRDHAILAGVLAVFPAFYLPYLTVTDTFGPYLFLGGCFFLVVGDRRLGLFDRAGLLGLVAGLMHLTRADGLLWLVVAVLSILFFTPDASLRARFGALLLCLAGYLAVMLPWFVRNQMAFGVPLAPGGDRALWLTDYDQTFAYPADRLTFRTWLESGWTAIVRARLWALGMNLATALVVQGEIFLAPLVLVGAWALRADMRLRIALLGWGLTLLAMTFAFPFAGARGGFFHSGAALQPVWWAVAPLGLERAILWARRWRKWKEDGRAEKAFALLLVGLVILLSVAALWPRLAEGAWEREHLLYQQIGARLEAGETVVMVANPPGYYLASGSPAIMPPNGDLTTVLEVAQRYRAGYLVLEPGAMPAGLLPVYENPQGQAGLIYLGEVEGARLFAIQP